MKNAAPSRALVQQHQSLKTASDSASLPQAAKIDADQSFSQNFQQTPEVPLQEQAKSIVYNGQMIDLETLGVSEAEFRRMFPSAEGTFVVKGEDYYL
ncbi:unnamed protein product [Soboliphyme baturini]|uniref:Plug domain-containing protein n=1 Tax=Soboliphyme baturini TaxID=241478 RepID=A0A183J2Q2_9BILA|nr:unnamed protein product [Soboliphyme baturini]